MARINQSKSTLWYKILHWLKSILSLVSMQ